jgi:hypothetical protein
MDFVFIISQEGKNIKGCGEKFVFFRESGGGEGYFCI